MNKLLRNILCLDDFEAAARRMLPRAIFSYVASGAERNQSVKRNLEAFAELYLIQHNLVNVSKRSTATRLFDHEYAAPFGIAPMGISSLSAYHGDIVQARGARDENIPMILSGSSLIPMEKIIKIAPLTWFQMYVPESIREMEALMDRVRLAGFQTLVITVDFAVSGNRENDTRAGFSTPLKLTPQLLWDGLSHPRWLISTWFRTLIVHGVPHFENNYAVRGAPILSKTVLRDFSGRAAFDWTWLERARERWPGKLVLKGLLNAEDVSKACNFGVDGLIISNHGGRQLDGAISPIDALPLVKNSVASGISIMVDGGIRRGSDAIKALALGADFVFVGRPFNYAATIAGADGVQHAIQILKSEIDRNLGLLGLQFPDELTEACLYKPKLRSFAGTAHQVQIR